MRDLLKYDLTIIMGDHIPIFLCIDAEVRLLLVRVYLEAGPLLLRGQNQSWNVLLSKLRRRSRQSRPRELLEGCRFRGAQSVLKS